MNRQIGILVSAMILASQLGSPTRAAEPTTDQLKEIAAMLSAEDYASLRSYIRANPDLLVEDSTLAGLFREFMEQPSSTAGGLDRNLSDALRRFSAQNSNDGNSNGGGPSQY